MKRIFIFLVLGLVSTKVISHEPEITRETICQTPITDTQEYFLLVDGADFGAPEIGKRYVKVWREQGGVDLLTIKDPLNHGGLNSGICSCGDQGILSCD